MQVLFIEKDTLPSVPLVMIWDKAPGKWIRENKPEEFLPLFRQNILFFPYLKVNPFSVSVSKRIHSESIKATED
jgi:hypothetical protein